MRIVTLIAVLIVTIGAQANAEALPGAGSGVSDRVRDHVGAQVPHALRRVLASFVGAREILSGIDLPSDLEGLPGGIVAAPSRVVDHDRGEIQDYRWRWKRDSAIVMRFLVRVMIEGELSSLPTAKKISLVKAYVNFCEREQLLHIGASAGRLDLGHAKVTLDVEKNQMDWGYPQSDGPPLEILTLYEVLRLVKQLGVQDIELMGQLGRVWERNVQFILENFDKPAVERWEEVKAESHFSILAEMVSALRLEQKLAEVWPTEVALPTRVEAVRLSLVIDEIKRLLRERHESRVEAKIKSHYNLLDVGSLVRDKDSALDMQVIMTSISINKYWEIDRKDWLYPPSHPLMRATFKGLRDVFFKKYKVNQQSIDPHTGAGLPGLVFGRYPEDRQHFGGAPWFITTFAAIQYLVWDALAIDQHGLEVSSLDVEYIRDAFSGDAQETPAIGVYPRGSRISLMARDGLLRQANDIFYRSMIHTGGADLMLSEIIDPQSGFKTGIEHLTWSYVEYLKTVRILDRAQKKFGSPGILRQPQGGPEGCLEILRQQR